MAHARFAILAAVLALWLAVAPAQAARTEGGAMSRVVSAEVRGFVFYSDGQTPAANTPVRVWDFQRREFIYETTTDDEGYFNLPKLQEGRYYVTFDWMKLELQVQGNTATFAQQPHDIIVIIPRGMGFMSFNQLTSLLLASLLSNAAIQNQWERPKIVSP
jgi:hypothetical protein